MKVGLGLYRHMLTREYYDFARQAGCTHVVIHLVDYFRQGSVESHEQSAYRRANTNRGEWRAIPKNCGRWMKSKIFARK